MPRSVCKLRAAVVISSLATLLSPAAVLAEPIMDDVERELRELAKLPAAAADAAASASAATPPVDSSKQRQEGGGEHEKGAAAIKKRRVAPPPPCLDRNPSCKEWAEIGECTASKRYMSDNCKMSCNLCNPLNFNKDNKGKEGIYQRFPGVRQKRRFKKSLIFKRYLDAGTFDINGTRDSLITSYEWDEGYAEQRVRDVMLTIDRYLHRERRIHKEETKRYAADPENYVPKPVVVAELCRNNDQHCALWAAWGYCDSHPRAMRDICPLACHTCHKYLPKLAQKPKSGEKIATSFFERMDMTGMSDATFEERLVAPFHWEADDGADGDRSSKDIYNMTRKAHAIRKVFNIDKITINGQFRIGDSMYTTSEENTEQGAVIEMAGFLQDDEVKEAFEFVRSRGIPEVDGVKDRMGFGPKSEDKVKFMHLQDPDNATENLPVRRSSQSYIHDISNEDPKDKNAFYTILFKICAKIELLTGLPCQRRYFELPIKFIKFEEGDYQTASLHFGTSVEASDPRLEDSLVEYDYKVGAIQQAGRDDFLVDVIPRTMNNPRVFGLTICLNNMKDGGGGSIFIDGRHYTPKKGLALFYPVVKSLLGNKHAEFAHAEQEIFHLLDKNFENDDGTHLVEDLELPISHDVVNKGTKYIMQMYFKRFPRQTKDSYSLDGRTHKSGRAVDTQDVERFVDGILEPQECRSK